MAEKRTPSQLISSTLQQEGRQPTRAPESQGTYTVHVHVAFQGIHV